MGFNIHPRVGVGVLILDSQDRLLLGKRIVPHEQDTWGPVGGHLECGETIEECAIREAAEEVGLEICNPSFLCITNDIFALDKHYISIFMVARVTTDQKLLNKEPDKVTEWRWFNIGRLPEPLFLPLQNLLSNKQYGQSFLESREKVAA